MSSSDRISPVSEPLPPVHALPAPLAGLLPNPFWHSLTGPHARFAIGGGLARRFDPEVSVFAALADASAEAWVDLADITPPASGVVLFRAGPGDVPAPFTELGGGGGSQYVWDPSVPVSVPSPGGNGMTWPPVPLGPADAEEMVALTALAEPGPFSARTVELGGYLGVRDDGGRLVAMAGERCRVAGGSEISAVCSHPDVRGRGLGGAITLAVAREIVDRGDVPFLHVAEQNTGAAALYERLGFLQTRTFYASFVYRS